LVHLENTPIMNFRWLWERQLNILIQVEKFWSYFAKSCDLCLRIEAKIEQAKYFHPSRKAQI
jgi:hypothetical protein